MAKKLEHWEVVNGIWSPRDKAYSYIVVEAFDSYKEAQRCARSLKADPTVAILHVLTRVAWRAGEPPFAPPQWTQREEVQCPV